jgi:hypothetical protein
MKTKRTLAGAIAIIALSGMLVAAQMQMRTSLQTNLEKLLRCRKL